MSDADAFTCDNCKMGDRLVATQYLDTVFSQGWYAVVIVIAIVFFMVIAAAGDLERLRMASRPPPRPPLLPPPPRPRLPIGLLGGAPKPGGLIGRDCGAPFHPSGVLARGPRLGALRNCNLIGLGSVRNRSKTSSKCISSTGRALIDINDIDFRRRLPYNVSAMPPWIKRSSTHPPFLLGANSIPIEP